MLAKAHTERVPVTCSNDLNTMQPSGKETQRGGVMTHIRWSILNKDACNKKKCAVECVLKPPSRQTKDYKISNRSF